MFQGKVNQAISVLSNQDSCGILNVNDPVSPSDDISVLDVLKSKHPQGRPLMCETLVGDGQDPPLVHPIIYESIDDRCIRSAVLSTFGAGGPSQTDAHCWRRLCTSFKAASVDLCHSLALVARKLCMSHVDPDGLSACRLVALDKNPGVRPIGICETPRRIIAKAVLSVVRYDVTDAAGSRVLVRSLVSRQLYMLFISYLRSLQPRESF